MSRTQELPSDLVITSTTRCVLKKRKNEDCVKCTHIHFLRASFSSPGQVSDCNFICSSVCLLTTDLLRICHLSYLLLSKHCQSLASVFLTFSSSSSSKTKTKTKTKTQRQKQTANPLPVSFSPSPHLLLTFPLSTPCILHTVILKCDWHWFKYWNVFHHSAPKTYL